MYMHTHALTHSSTGGTICDYLLEINWFALLGSGGGHPILSKVWVAISISSKVEIAIHSYSKEEVVIPITSHTHPISDGDGHPHHF